MTKKIFPPIIGLVAGIINGLLGAGGGMIIVPMLVKYGLKRQEAHATSLSIILPICLVSSVIYILTGRVDIFDAIPYLPWGILGAVIGTAILSRINKNLLRKIFGIIIIIAAVRLLIK